MLNEIESYQNILVDGEPFEGKMMDIGGTRSAGEYGSVLWNLFHPSTQADFKRGRLSVIRGRDAHEYEFHVQKPRSRWNVIVNQREIVPAYNGRVWIEKGPAALCASRCRRSSSFGLPRLHRRIRD